MPDTVQRTAAAFAAGRLVLYGIVRAADGLQRVSLMAGLSAARLPAWLPVGSILSAAATEGVLHIALTLIVALFVAALFAVFALHVAEVPGEGEVGRAALPPVFLMPCEGVAAGVVLPFA